MKNRDVTKSPDIPSNTRLGSLIVIAQMIKVTSRKEVLP